MSKPVRLTKVPGPNDHWFETSPGFVGSHHARPVPEAEALEAVVAAARRERAFNGECSTQLLAALDRLDALTKGDGDLSVPHAVGCPMDMPDPQEPRTGGVAVTRYISRIHDELRVARYDYTDDPPPDVRGEPGTWFPLAEAEARQEVLDAAAAYRHRLNSAASKIEIERAVVRLCIAVDSLRYGKQQPPDDDGTWMRGVG